MLIVTCRQLSTDGRRRELRQRRHPLLHPVEPGDGAHVQRVLSRVSERDHHLRPVPSDRRHVLLVAKAVHQELRSRQYSSFLLSFYSSMWRCDPLEPVYNSLHQFTIFQPISNGSTCFNRVVVIVLTFSPQSGLRLRLNRFVISTGLTGHLPNMPIMITIVVLAADC